MEIFGGFMVMVSIIGFFLAVVWLVMPFVVFAIKGKQDRTLDVLESIDKRLSAIEAALQPVAPVGSDVETADNSVCVGRVQPTEAPVEKISYPTLPAA